MRGQHRPKDKNGFENSQFKKVIKIPDGVDPTLVASTASEDGRALVLTGIKRVEENKKDYDKKFAVKLNLSGYKPDEVKVQLRGQELTVKRLTRVNHHRLTRKLRTLGLNSYVHNWYLSFLKER